jgi:hypothetical protein
MGDIGTALRVPGVDEEGIGVGDESALSIIE